MLVRLTARSIDPSAKSKELIHIPLSVFIPTTLKDLVLMCEYNIPFSFFSYIFFRVHASHTSIDLFSLYVLLPHFRPRDVP